MNSRDDDGDIFTVIAVADVGVVVAAVVVAAVVVAFVVAD